MQRFDIAVVGAGIAGASVAARLARAGKHVALLDMESQAGYHTTGAGPTATSCGASSGDYTLSGCAPAECIARTTAVAGFATLPVCEDMTTG